jgi:hypothetical protein
MISVEAVWRKWRVDKPAAFVRSPASEQSAHHAANQSTWTATTTVMVSTTPAATTGRTVVIGFVAAAQGRVRC